MSSYRATVWIVLALAALASGSRCIAKTRVQGVVFHDCNGNGTKDRGEPSLPGVKLTFQPGGVSCSTDASGELAVDIAPGDYRVYVSDAPGEFGYFLPAVSEAVPIGDGLRVVVGGDVPVLVPLAHGFLTWPFPRGTAYTRHDYLGRDSVFDRDRREGSIEAYDPSIPTVCTGSVCVVDNHSGLDIGVGTGTSFVAAADLRITGYKRIPGEYGRTVGVITVSYGGRFEGRYAHAVLMSGMKAGDAVPRSRPLGTVEDSDIGSSHLHFELSTLPSSEPVDPYDYWTVYRKPQYSSPTHTPPPRVSAAPSPSPSPALAQVTNLVFQDYNGNGTQDAGEPPIGEIGLTYRPGGASGVTDKTGKVMVFVTPGSYRLQVEDASGRFRYILPSVSEVRDIGDGLEEEIAGDTAIAVPLAEGFLTLPFKRGTVFGRPSPFGLASVFDLDPGEGWASAYRDDIRPVWEARHPPWVMDNHTGLDFCVPEGTEMVAAMPGEVTYVGRDKYGGLGIWICNGPWANYYNHNSRILVEKGQRVSRGQVIAISGNTGQSGEPHLHFALSTCSTPPRYYEDSSENASDAFATESAVAPYRSAGYWTARNKPKYPF